MSNGVKFGDKHSITNWDLLMVAKSIGEATPKTKYIEVPFSNGTKDLTEAFGEVKYNDRTLSFTFDMFQSPKDWLALKQSITNYLHGKKLKITLDTDPNYYYYGRCEVKSFANTTTVGHLQIDCICEPYKYKLNKTIDTRTVAVNNVLVYENDRKTVIPTITLSSAMILSFKGNTYSLGAGTHKILDIQFVEGDNVITIIQGSGTLTLEYQEGAL